MIRLAARWLARSLRAILWLALFVAVIGVVALRYWVFPNVETYREDIARSISKAAGQRITIGKILPGWEQLQPHLHLQQVTVFDRENRPALALENISGTVSWLSLLLGEVNLKTLSLDAPVLTISRDRNGVTYVAGIAMNQQTNDFRFSDWLLRQNRITIQNAVILWRDDLRNAPPLVLRDLDFDLTSRRDRHRFILSAIPPESLAQPLSISGNVVGKSLRDKSQWQGTLHASLENTDITQWKNWLDLPIEVNRGFGNLRVWLSLLPNQAREVRLSLALRDAALRINPDLPELDLTSLSGAVAWRKHPQSNRLQFEQLSAATRNGITLQPFDLTLSLETDASGGTTKGSLSGNRMVLDRLHYFTRFFPLGEELRATLEQLRPRGAFDSLQAGWTGPWAKPVTYKVDARFSGLASAAYKMLPAFSNVSGMLKADELQGSATILATNTALAMPAIFPESIPISRLSLETDWRWRKQLLELNLKRVQVDNPHLAGSVSALFRQTPKGHGVINLDGKLSRADARYVYRYLPTSVGQATREWLRDSIKSGHSQDARVVLRGNLDNFPFDHGRPGTFRVTAKVHDGKLAYARDWPEIDAIEGSLLFDAAGMKINVASARVFRSTLHNVEAVIPDLIHHDELLQIGGRADAYTADMLEFIERSAVKDRINNAARGIKADGKGKLEIRLDMPLRRLDQTRVRGSYSFIDNALKAEFLPAVRRINGKLEFTQASVSAQGLSLEAAGGPVQLNVATIDDSVKIDAQGRFSAASLREFSDLPLLQHLRGGSGWRGALVLKKNASSIAVESNLQGLQSLLPEPFAKRANDAVPLRVERQTSASGDVIGVSYNRTMNAILARRLAGGRLEIDRGHVNLNGPATMPRQRGIALDAALKFVDIDAWRNTLKKAGATASSDVRSPSMVALISAIDLRADTIDLFGKRMHEVKLDANPTANGWRGQLASREAAGDLTWVSAGKGLLRAHLRHLIIPTDAPPTAAPAADASSASRDPLPALEIIAESLAYGEKKLGRLDLNADNIGRDWRIEKLVISNPDATLTMDGRWRDWLAQPKTDVDLQLDVKDAGKFLTRIGYPNAIKRGSAKLSGQLSWLGGPAALNFATMSGNFSLQAERGQFLKADPGFGKLLGILSLQALPRRITLDFRDVFSEGFAFDSITGTMLMTRGVLYSSDFKMRGPAANVTMSGGTNLALETLNLKVRIVPVLGGSVAIAGALLGGPVVGLGTLLVQKVLRDPIDQMAAFEYSISGTWDNPSIAKLSRRVEPSE